MFKKGIFQSVIIVLCMTLIIGAVNFFESSSVEAASFAKGADISWVLAMEEQGYVWYDKNGNERDILEILKNDYNINSVRIRTWVNPSNDYGNGYLNKDRSIALAKRAKDMGFKICFNFHYSDSWADPGKQYKPSAWENLSFEELMKEVYDYTYEVMSDLASEGIYPEWVQVGNETNNGMLWEDGRASENMRNFAWLVNCGYDAVKAVSSDSKVIVHLSNGYDNTMYRWMFDGLINNGAKFDIIGMSLYPTSSNWQTLNEQCLSNMRDMKSRYGKEVMICEIGMDYSEEVAAKSFISDIVDKTKSVGGKGVFYWEPQAYPNYNAGYRKGAWNSNGRPTLALEGFGYNENNEEIPTPPPDNGDETVPQNIYGDLNGDGKIDSTDYTLLRRYILEITDGFPSENGFINADVNGDGIIDSNDLVFMGRYLLEIIDEFPVESN
ncbi:glycosyl hydrolase 53 family protein [Herbivorax sp. ANBcel31]|uniref:glycosyl hydrolase 53 family protein n=1 Tax=Herbivorax sp. ANBcel31 TaxID=3069754 RepID=UPI0027B11E6E|nr:glycosyl hydrolase 53 family protein [Herbivorax sp. ANBcel31]MDQ2085198.1 glycosyl hydrolase 53 family protein [Herbivorax sp. ANBcel31]